MPRDTLIQIRRGTASSWNSSNGNLGAVLSAGEFGYETDTGRLKIGDGSTVWNNLPYSFMRYNDLVSGSGIGLEDLTNASGQVTGVKLTNKILAGSNITLSLSDGNIVINGSSPVTLSAGTGIHIVQNGNDFNINVSGLTSSLIGDFNSAVDARVTAGSISAEEIRDIVATGVNGGTGIYIQYDDNGTQLININVTGVSFAGHTHDDRYYTETELSTSGGGGQVHWANITNTPTGFTPVSHTHQSTQISDFTEAVQDVVGTNAGSTGFLRNGSGIAWNYNDGSDTLSVSITGIPSSLITDFSTAVSDQVDTTLAAGTGIVLSYNGGTNTLTIDTSGYSLLNHTHVWSNITDASATASLTELAYLSGVTAGTAAGGRAVVLDSNKNINGIGTITTTGNVTVGGNLIVNGTTTTVNSTTVDIGDNIIQVNVSGSESLGGLQVLDHDNSLLHQIVWDINDSRWEFISNSGSSPNVYTSGNISANTLTSTVSDGTAPLTVSSTTVVNNLNADLLDGQHGSYYRNFSNLSGLPSPIITGTLTGDVTGSASVTLTDLGNGVLTINTSIASNSVALGSDTTGQYASTVSVAGTGLSATTPNGDDGTAYTITSNATPANATGTLVARDSSGGFSAGLVSATGFSGDGSSITNLNASNINAGTIGVSYLPTNIPVTNLTNSGITIGSTVINLGQTKTAFAGLTALSGVSAGSPLVITYAHIDGGSP